MEFTVAKSDLQKELQLCQGVVERRSTIPILSNILLKATKDRIELAATDLDVTLQTACDASVKQQGKVTIDARRFFDIVRSLPEDDVKISLGFEVDKRLFTARYEWKQFRRWFRTSGGIVVSPFSRKNYLDNFRGVHLLLPADAGKGRMTNLECRMPVRTEDIVAYLEKRFAPPPPEERLTLDDESSRKPSE